MLDHTILGQTYRPEKNGSEYVNQVLSFIAGYQEKDKV